MFDSNKSIHIPNPDTYLNHLSPTEGLEFQIRDNILMILLGAIVWDTLAYLTIDSEIVISSRFNFNIFCFMFSRIFALSHTLLVIVPAGNNVSPRLLFIIMGCSCMLSMMTSSFLCLQRVLAIYHGNRRVRRGFLLLWFVVSLSEIIILFGGHQHDIPGTKINKDFGIDVWVTTSIWLSFSFDSAVTLAVSYNMWLSHRLPNENLPWYYLVSGRTLPRLPRLIFRGELQYYLIIIWWVMVTGIAMCLPSVPQIYKSLFPTILTVLIASMASRLFRNLRLFDSDNILTESLPVG